MSPDRPWAVLGLGNPGERYARTRHNVGAMVAVALAESLSERMRTHRKTRCDVAQARIHGRRSIIAVPQSYMNESGGPAASLVNFFSVPVDRLIVVQDEIDLPFGRIRVKFGGGDNGHNGLRSIRRSLRTGDWFRVRMGVGRGRGPEAAEHVLSAFNSTERRELGDLTASGALACESLIEHGLAETQQRHNS